MAKGTCGLADTTLSTPRIKDSFQVDLDGVALSYDGLPLFSDLNFSLEPGRWTCLLGPSGVGKSSLLRMIAGLLPPERGQIRCSDEKEAHGRLAWMGQQDSLLPWLTAEQNVLLGTRLRGDPQDHAGAARLLEQVGIEAQASQLPATLSGGQRQRVALARTLMEDRSLVLMDEPFSALDAITRIRLQALAAKLLHGRTVLLVTHDPMEALRLGHNIFVMAGRPATVEAAKTPRGEPPRALDDHDLLERQADLLARLADAQDFAA